MLKVLVRADTADKGYDLTKYLDEKGCPWTIGDSEDDILIEWSDFYDYLSEDRDFKSRFFYSHETHFLESTGRVVGINELFPIRESTTFSLPLSGQDRFGVFKVRGYSLYPENRHVPIVGNTIIAHFIEKVKGG